MNSYDTIESVVVYMLFISIVIYLNLNLDDDGRKLQFFGLFRYNQFNIISYNCTTCSLAIMYSILKISGCVKGANA